MTNQKTHNAKHNEQRIQDILVAFRAVRTGMVERLDNCGATFFDRTALHPRLNKPMRVVDQLYFQAEHDDYHLARITEMLRLFRPT